MSIQTLIYLPNTEKKWRYKGENGVTGVTKGASNHSEQKLFRDYRGDGSLFLFVQNAFPCEKCHEYFQTLTKDGKTNVIFKITDNEGSYSADHDLGFKTALPKVIYYYLGKSVMADLPSSGKYVPPSDFPPHADIIPI